MSHKTKRVKTEYEKSVTSESSDITQMNLVVMNSELMSSLSVHAGEPVFISARGVVYYKNRPLIIDTESSVPVAAFFTKYDQCVMFGVSDGFAEFINSIIELWGEKQGTSGGESKVLMFMKTDDKYPPQMKIKHHGPPMKRGDIVERFFFEPRCYTYRKDGVVMCGVYFKQMFDLKVLSV